MSWAYCAPKSTTRTVSNPPGPDTPTPSTRAFPRVTAQSSCPVRQRPALRHLEPDFRSCSGGQGTTRRDLMLGCAVHVAGQAPGRRPGAGEAEVVCSDTPTRQGQLTLGCI